MLQIVGRGGREGGREGKIVIPMSEALRAADNKQMSCSSAWKTAFLLLEGMVSLSIQNRELQSQ
jgi:hypothetical protein